MLKISTPVRILALVSLAFGLVAPLAVSAQSAQTSILVNQVNDPVEIPQNPGVPFLKFDMIFTPLNPDGSVITLPTDNSATQASIQISTGTFSAALTPVSTPWSIAMIIDAGGNMADAKAAATFKSVKSSLAAKFGGSQQGNTIEAYSFSDTIKQVLAFKDSGDQQKVQQALNGIPAKASTKFCMNDAMTQGINDLAGATGRKAILLFTASVDNCASQSAQQVVDLAKRNKVEIFAVGLNGYVTQPQLDAIAAPTGGIAYIKDPPNLVFAFGNVNDIFNHQIQAIAKLSPKAGQQQANLILTLSDASTITSGPISFTAPHDFIAQPSITLIGKVQPKADGVTFNLDITSQEQINSLQVDAISKNSGLSVSSQTLRTFGRTNNVVIAGLQIGEDYTLVVQALDGNGLPLGDPQRQDFNFQPEQLALAISKLNLPDQNADQFSLTVDPPKPDGVFKFRIFLADPTDKTPLSTPITVGVGEPLVIPADKVEAGQYIIMVQALDAGEGDQAKVLAAAASDKFTYAPASWFDKLILTLKTNPLALAGIGGLCCVGVLGLGAVVYFLIPKNNAKVKEVEIFVPEKQRRIVPNTSSGVFDREGERREPERPPQRERERERPRPAPEPPPQRQAAPREAAPQQPAVSVPPAVLSAQNPPTAMLRTPIRKSPTTIGRRDGNDVVLKVDNSMGVSGQHCTITFSNGQFFVVDEGSTYGTTVNGKTIQKGQPTPLADGAQIGLGPKVVLIFRLGQ